MVAMAGLPPFNALAGEPDPRLDLLMLALAAEFRDVDEGRALAVLDRLGAELGEAVARTDGSPHARVRAVADLLGGVHGFAGDRERYDHPDNSMLDVVLVRRRGLPILLSVVYVEVARRAGVELAGVGLPGHFVVAHLGRTATVVIDPFAGGGPVERSAPAPLVRPWGAREIAMRALNNLVAAYRRRGDVGGAIRAAGMRLALPAEDRLREELELELRVLQAKLN
jgi:regulator of sirC expression with transglutaminase-like and TPR domain